MPTTAMRNAYVPNYGVAVKVPTDYTDDQIDAYIQRNKAAIMALSPVAQRNQKRIAEIISQRADHARPVDAALAYWLTPWLFGSACLIMLGTACRRYYKDNLMEKFQKMSTEKKQLNILWGGAILFALVLLFPPHSRHLFWGEYVDSSYYYRSGNTQEHAALAVIAIFTALGYFTARKSPAKSD